MSTQRPVPSIDRETPEHVLHRLDWQLLSRLDGILQGDYRSLFMGGGLDFAELREYQPPDDIRHIDWNVTARMDIPYVRQYMEDREVTAWFLVDLSPSMAFGALERQKESVIVDLVGVLARLLTRNGNRVGAILYDNNIEYTIPPRGGRPQVLRLINDIQRQQSSPGGAMTDLAKLLQSAYNSVKRRSLFFLVSDFISLPGWDKAMDRLNRKHELLAVRVWDPARSESSRRRRRTRRGLGDGCSNERGHERQGIPAAVLRGGAPTRRGAGTDFQARGRGRVVAFYGGGYRTGHPAVRLAAEQGAAAVGVAVVSFIWPWVLVSLLALPVCGLV